MGNAEDIRTLAEEVVVSYDARIAGIGEIRKETDRLLKDFHTTHEKMGKELRKDLAQGVSNRVTEVTDLVGKFHSLHQEMGKALRDALSKGETDRLATFKEMDAGIKARIGEIEDETHKLLSESETDRLKAFRSMDKDVKASVDRIKKETKRLLKELATANEAVAKEWSNLTVLMEKKRAGKEVRPKVVEAKPKVEKPLVVKPPLREVPVVESLEAKVLGIIKKSSGITLSEIGEVLGIHFVRVGGIAKTLVEQGKVRKEDKNYYPVG